MRVGRGLAGLIVWAMLCSASLYSSPVRAQQQLNVGAYHYSGDYDRDEKTSFSIVPISWSYKKKPWKFKVSSSWVSVDGPGDINGTTTEEGTVVIRDEVESGVGDLRLAMTYQFQTPLPGRIWVDGRLILKIPLADESKGLGTGEADQKVVFDFIKLFPHFYGLLTLSYNRRGQPEDLSLKDIRALSLGFSQSLDGGRSWGIFYDIRTESKMDSHDIQELSVFYSLPVNKDWKISPYGLLGLNNSSAQYGMGVGASFRF
ncbi:MAG: hypothetical protein KUG82_07220 [Pseudomonadales bacterium]|nr:hypothetical protein [Pseudomonadales bacterium]